ncbi:MULTISPECIES: ABC transporter permease [Vagococcus]|uniref:ABC transporter, permease protein n=1 Tax=Vagococcus fluvialis bH819 TaxID=1255619 RepID=A0A1X6WLT3_9ENTE|nr:MULTISPECIES: ABC transporter permease [Vagococcus]SLM85219.1 ABC transporter, permease protein [Vagococcus fluvialis bH819]HCM88368.1 ABC transporter permease [Vagococcus sp.]
MNKFWVVALETYKKHVKSVSFVMMIIAPLLFMGIFAGSTYMGQKFNHSKEVAIVSEVDGLSQAFTEQTKKEFDINKKIKTEDGAKKALEKEEIDGYIAIRENQDKLAGHYIGVKTLGTDSLQVIQQNLNQLQLGLNAEKLSLSQEEVAKLLSPATVDEKQVKITDGKIEENKDNKAVMMIVGMVVVFMMYFIVLLYSSITAQEVASEKGTRIMEVILSSTTASKHFYGKITGISLVILTQVGVYLVTGVVGFIFVKDMDIVKMFFEEIPAADLLRGLLGYNLLYLLFGVLIYTILAAFLGSLVSKAEDSAKAVAPLTYLTMIGFIGSFSVGMSNPQSIIIKVMSFIPFLSSFGMPVRIANNEVSNMEVLISLSILVISILVLLKISAKAYKSTVLIYSDKSMMNVFKDAMNLAK